MSELVKLYSDILKSLGLTVDDKGMVFMPIDGVNHIFNCNKKRLVLPTNDILRASQWNELIAFHPLSENIVRGVSPVLEKTRTVAVHRLTQIIADLMMGLIALAADTDAHKTLDPNQARFLKLVPEADATTVANFRKIITTMVDNNHQLINIYLKRGADINGQKFNRGAIVTFPVLAELTKDSKEVYGITLRAADKAAFIAILEYLVPEMGVLNKYSVGSSSMVAPYFDSLVRAFVNVAKMLNSVTERFASKLETADGNPIQDSCYVNLTWFGSFDQLARYKDLIPVLEGNDGPPDTNAMGSAARSLAGTPVTEMETPPPTAVIQNNHQPQQPYPSAPINPMMAPQPTGPYGAVLNTFPTTRTDPRDVVITDPNFKPLGGGTVVQPQGGSAPASSSNVTDDWDKFLQQKQMMARPVFPVFQGVSTPQAPVAAPPPYPMNPMAATMVPPGYPPMNPYGALPTPYGYMGQPQQQQNPYPVFQGVGNGNR